MINIVSTNLALMSFFLATASNMQDKVEQFRDEGFGLFIHWGPVAQIGKEISWPVCEASEEFRDEYFSLYKTFNPEKFNPQEWAKLSKKAGMRYVVFTTKHHAGFNMFDTALSDYNIMNTPYGKDICAQLAEAFRKEGISVGWYYSPPDWHYFYKTGVKGSYRKGGPISNYKEPYGTKNLTLLEYELGQMEELFTKYGDIDLVFFDTLGWDATPLKEKVWEIKPEVVVTRSEIPTPEQSIPDEAPEGVWETCMTMGGQWAYKPDDNYKSVKQLVHNLVRIRATGGNYLLNVGPKADGTLPEPQVEILEKLGEWNKVNDEAIHEVRPWNTCREDDIWFTKKKDQNIVYAFFLELPEQNLVTIKALKDMDVKSVEMLGANKKLNWTKGEDGLKIEFPDSDELSEAYTYTLKLEQ